MNSKNILRCLILAVMLIYASMTVSSVSCDCNPGAGQNRVCLYTDPSNIVISSATFDFDIKIRNFFRTSSGAAITDITTIVQSCTGSGGSCTWTGSSRDFTISINPSVIARSQAGDYGVCGTSASQCRSCNTGRLETVNVEITIDNAPDGDYTILFDVSYGNTESSSIKHRTIEVDFSFSSGGCTPDCSGKECGGDGCGGSCGSCSGGQTCQNGQCVSSVICGDGSVGAGEECEGPNTNNNQFCSQSTEFCEGSKVRTRDGYGRCNSACGCVEDVFGTASCVAGKCSAACSNGQSRACTSGLRTGTQACTSSCSSGNCVNAGCTSDSDCSGGFVCNVGSGLCFECLGVGDCDDSEECTTDSCVSNFCAHSKIADGSSCSGGSCCTGKCVTSIENDDFAVDCRGGPLCVAGVLRYYFVDNGNLCGGFLCRECLNGFCSFDDSSRCGFGKVCVAGSCSSSGCSGDSDCSVTPSTPYCDTGSGQCVECLSAGQCDDSNECTTDNCVSGSCSFTSLSTGSSCSGCDDSSCGCVLGVCVNLGSGCTGDSDCSSGTHCNTVSGLCVECILSSQCDDGNVCTSGSCISGSCIFGNVADGFVCSGCGDASCVCSGGSCVSGVCVPDCTGKVCGDNGCGGVCGTCLAGESCVSGVCVAGCTPDCSGKSCGSDGCGGSCGSCVAGESCVSGVCVVPGGCVPDWSCSDWTDCRVDGTKVRFCFDKKGCGGVAGKPAITDSCVYGEDVGVDTDVGGGVDTDVGDGAGNVSDEGFDEGKGGVGGGFPLGSVILIVIIVGLGFIAFIFKGQLASLFQGSSKRPGSGLGAGPGMGLGAGPGGLGSAGLSPRELSAYNYIKMNLDRGYSPMQIRQTLMNAGWSPEELDKLFKRFP